MKRAPVLLSAAALLALAAAACSSNSDSDDGQATSTSGAATATAPSRATQATGSPTTATTTGGQAIVLGDTIKASAGATVSGSDVTITKGGTWTISGTLKDGMVKVATKGEAIDIVLDGAAITNGDGPALYLAEGTEATVTLQAGTKNTLADGGTAEEDAALYAAMPLTIKGEGDLTVHGNANEGISSTMHITFASGNVRVYAVEDGVNANNDGVSIITVSGGYLYVQSETGDAIDSNGTIVINGGTVLALGSPDKDASNGLDADGGVTINGGAVIGTGQQAFRIATDSKQKGILANFGATQKAGTLVSIQKDGATILAIAPEAAFPNLFFSNATIADNVTYTVFTGGTASGNSTDGVYANTTVTGATQVTTTTTASLNTITGPGGRPPR